MFMSKPYPVLIKRMPAAEQLNRSVYTSMSVSLYIPECLSVHPYHSVCPFIYITMSVCLCIPPCLSVYPLHSVFLFIHSTVPIPLSKPQCLSVYPYHSVIKHCFFYMLSFYLEKWKLWLWLDHLKCLHLAASGNNPTQILLVRSIHKLLIKFFYPLYSMSFRSLAPLFVKYSWYFHSFDDPSPLRVIAFVWHNFPDACTVNNLNSFYPVISIYM